MFTNHADAVALIVGLVLPALVAVFTKPSTNSTVKGIAHAVLAVATGSLAVYKAYPSQFLLAPAVVAAFLAWLSGTAAYHSLLKKYAWFGALQNLFVKEAEVVVGKALHISDTQQITQLFQVAQAAEEADDAAGITNDFPLSTDVVEAGVEDAVKVVEEIPGVGQAVQAAETVVVPAIAQAVETVVVPAVSGTGPIPVVQQTSALGQRAI